MDKKVKVASINATPIVIMIGIVPVVLIPDIDVFLGCDGTVSFGLSTGAKVETALEVGLTYENGSWYYEAVPNGEKIGWQIRENFPAM